MSLKTSVFLKASNFSLTFYSSNSNSDFTFCLVIKHILHFKRRSVCPKHKVTSQANDARKVNFNTFLFIMHGTQNLAAGQALFLIHKNLSVNLFSKARKPKLVYPNVNSYSRSQWIGSWSYVGDVMLCKATAVTVGCVKSRDFCCTAERSYGPGVADDTIFKWSRSPAE